MKKNILVDIFHDFGVGFIARNEWSEARSLVVDYAMHHAGATREEAEEIFVTAKGIADGIMWRSVEFNENIYED